MTTSRKKTSHMIIANGIRRSVQISLQEYDGASASFSNDRVTKFVLSVMERFFVVISLSDLITTSNWSPKIQSLVKRLVLTNLRFYAAKYQIHHTELG